MDSIYRVNALNSRSVGEILEIIEYLDKMHYLLNVSLYTRDSDSFSNFKDLHFPDELHYHSVREKLV